MLSPYLNSDDENEQKKESLPIDEAKKIFNGEKTSILQFKSKKKMLGAHISKLEYI